MEKDVIDGLPIYTFAKKQDLRQFENNNNKVEQLPIFSQSSDNTYNSKKGQQQLLTRRIHAKKLVNQVDRNKLYSLGFFKNTVHSRVQNHDCFTIKTDTAGYYVTHQRAKEAVTAVTLTEESNVNGHSLEKDKKYENYILTRIRTENFPADNNSENTNTNILDMAANTNTNKDISENLPGVPLPRTVTMSDTEETHHLSSAEVCDGHDNIYRHHDQSYDSLSPPVLTPEVPFTLWCDKCNSKQLYNDIELYNHIKTAHSDDHKAVASEDNTGNKRKGDSINNNPVTPDKIQKVLDNTETSAAKCKRNLFSAVQESRKHVDNSRNITTGTCSSPKSQTSFPNISKLVTHIQSDHTSKSALNKAEEIHFDKNCILPGKKWWCEKCFLKLDCFEDWKIHQLLHKNAFYEKPTSPSSAPLFDRSEVQAIYVSSSLNSSKDDMRGIGSVDLKNNGKEILSLTPPKNVPTTGMSKCIPSRNGGPSLTSEDSLDMFFGRTTDSVFSPLKLGTTDVNMPQKQASISSNPMSSCTSVQSYNHNVYQQDGISYGRQQNIIRYNLMSGTNQHFYGSTVNTLGSNGNGNQLINVKKYPINNGSVANDVSPCIIMPSQNISVLSQQARFDILQTTGNTDQLTEGGLSSANRPVSTCVIQPALSTVIQSHKNDINQPAVTNTVQSTSANNISENIAHTLLNRQNSVVIQPEVHSTIQQNDEYSKNRGKPEENPRCHTSDSIVVSTLSSATMTTFTSQTVSSELTTPIPSLINVVQNNKMSSAPIYSKSDNSLTESFCHSEVNRPNENETLQGKSNPEVQLNSITLKTTNCTDVPVQDVPVEKNVKSSLQSATVLSIHGSNTHDETSTAINKQTKSEIAICDESQREGIFVVCTNCGTNSARYDICDSCHKALPLNAKLYEPITRTRSYSDGAEKTCSKNAALRQCRNLSDSAVHQTLTSGVQHTQLLSEIDNKKAHSAHDSKCIAKDHSQESLSVSSKTQSHGDSSSPELLNTNLENEYKTQEEHINLQTVQRLIDIPSEMLSSSINNENFVSDGTPERISIHKTKPTSTSEGTSQSVTSTLEGTPLSVDRAMSLSCYSQEDTTPSLNASLSESDVSSSEIISESQSTVCIDDEDEDVVIVDEKPVEFKRDLAFLKPNRRRIKPRLLEIMSNCDYTKIRCKITSLMSKVLGNSPRYPDTRVFTVDNFSINILPKPNQQTKVPKNLIAKFDGFFVYPIRIKITNENNESNKDVIDLTQGHNSTKSDQSTSNIHRTVQSQSTSTMRQSVPTNARQILQTTTKETAHPRSQARSKREFSSSRTPRKKFDVGGVIEIE